MAGVAVSDALREHTGLRPDLRWPNDLLLNGKKFCGILTELSSDGAAVRHAAIDALQTAPDPAVAARLIELFRTEQDVNVRKAILKALFSLRFSLMTGLISGQKIDGSQNVVL